MSEAPEGEPSLSKEAGSSWVRQEGSGLDLLLSYWTCYRPTIRDFILSAIVYVCESTFIFIFVLRSLGFIHRFDRGVVIDEYYPRLFVFVYISCGCTFI